MTHERSESLRCTLTILVQRRHTHILQGGTELIGGEAIGFLCACLGKRRVGHDVGADAECAEPLWFCERRCGTEADAEREGARGNRRGGGGGVGWELGAEGGGVER